MADVLNFKCPSCGAPLIFKGGTQKMTCEYCMTEFTMEQAQAAQAAEEADAASSDMVWTQPEQELIQDENGQVTGFHCPSCGAEIVADETTAATECPYCGNQAIVPQAFEGTYKPDCMIPFKLDKEKASGALEKFYEGKKLLPDAFKENNRIKNVQGVYVPFWLMSCKAEGAMTFNGVRAKTWSDANNTYIKKDHYLINRVGVMDFSRIPVDASKQMDDALMDGLEPYNYGDFVPYDKAYFSGYLADRYDVSAEEAQPRANTRIENTVVNKIRSSVTGFTEVSERSKRINTSDDKTEYAMLPVWMLSTKYEDKVYTFAMNGQTGKMVGTLPVDSGKYWKYFALGTLIPLIICLVVLYLLQKMTTMPIVIAAVVCLLIGFIYVSALKSAMNTAVIQTQADKYLEDLDFKVRNDVFMYSHTDVRPKPKRE
ncbi:MAG: hypothetical protein K5989_11870 [Lachnospiraceae bacterium]|nr:hypothetical protein [Lachnospiraceae bacterium]